MKKILKVVGIVLASIGLIVFVFYIYASWQVDARLGKKYYIIPERFPIPSDSAAIAWGKHLVDIKGCSDCHGDDLAGKVFNDDALIGTMAGPNLTYGRGGLPHDYVTADWVRALKHGLNRENLPLIVMPSLETSKMSQEDMKAMIAYLNSLPPIDNIVPKSNLGIMMKVLVHLDQVPIISAEKIDHNSTLAINIDRSSPLVYGKYLAVMCSACHRDNMKGGEPMVPGLPSVPDLTSTGASGRWTQDQFNEALRTGKRPDGTALDPSMPWQMTKHYSDDELQALYTYFKSL
jgi:cytochrome c553